MQDDSRHEHGITRSPAVSPGRPLSVRHLSADLETYIDMYGLSQDIDKPGAALQAMEARSETDEEHDFLFVGGVDQELANLQKLRRLSLDVSSFDPDVPPENYKLEQRSQELNAKTTENGDSQYWVPARIHPELAPQEWQSFVQKTGMKNEEDLAPGLFSRKPSVKGLTRSKSILSREISGKAAENYTDSGHGLGRRRSGLQINGTEIKLEDLSHDTRGRSNEGTLPEKQDVIPEEGSSTASDAPILIPPPGQILRRAARTGKAKGSYRKFAKPKNISSQDVHESEPIQANPNFESEVIQLKEATPPPPQIPALEVRVGQDESTPEIPDKAVERKKSRNRATQVVGPTSPVHSGAPDDPLPHREEAIPLATAIVENVTKAAVLRPQVTEVDPPHDVLVSTPEQPPNIAPVAPIHDSHTTTSPAVSNDAQEEPHAGPTTEDLGRIGDNPSRPGLKRELSAASLTRAVMSGQGPLPSTNKAKNTPNRQVQEDSPNDAQVQTGKKSAWGKLFSTEDKSKSKKDTKTAPKMKRIPSQEERPHSEKDSSSTNIFSSIFGGKKKEKESIPEAPRSVTTPTPKAIVREPHFYSRYPIQLERAIYRMAHLKLASSRRPLCHQVLLSNFMYGYLALVGANTSGQAHGPSGGSRRPRNASTSQRSHHGDGPQARPHDARQSPLPHSNREQQAADPRAVDGTIHKKKNDEGHSSTTRQFPESPPATANTAYSNDIHEGDTQ